MKKYQKPIVEVIMIACQQALLNISGGQLQGIYQGATPEDPSEGR